MCLSYSRLLAGAGGRNCIVFNTGLNKNYSHEKDL